MVKNFVIPLLADELLTSHAEQYFVEEVVPLRMISQALDGNCINLIFNSTIKNTVFVLQ